MVTDGEGDAREGVLILLVAAGDGAGAGAGEDSFRRLAGGLVDVGEGVGSVFVTEGGFETTAVEVGDVRGGATTLVAG